MANQVHLMHARVVLFLALVVLLLAPGAASARIIIDQSEFTMRVFAHTGEQEAVFPVAVGRPSAPTPNGRFRIVAEVKSPAWKSPAGVFVPGGDPRNPLRAYWFTLSAPADPPGSVGIHGSSAVDSMGHPWSHGCIRLRPSDAIRLHELVDVGERVLIQP